MAAINHALELMKKIKTLEEESGRLVVELERSLLIRGLWPEAFSRGSVTSNVTGNPHHPHILTFTITQPGGGSRSYDLAAVPVELWSAQVLADLAKPGANPKYKQILKEWKVKQ